jgi:hypothetical protein
MSDIPADWRDRLNVREQIVRIDRSIDEAAKLRAEQGKLIAEGRKLDRDRWLAPLVLAASLAASLLGGVLVAVISHFWR